MINSDLVKPKPKQSGFTIVELLVVIVVIGILAAITIVSYAGITNRAIIASIQSDLTNASTLLKMDQITTESFPTTLALANSGKGITPSQTMDSVIYIPDNTSNPKNFCLQYKKGTITYAVDNSSVPSSGVCLQNLVGNGDFSQGTSGWSGSYGTISVAGNILTSIASGTIPTGRISSVISHPYDVGHKYYVSSKLRVTNSVCVQVNVTVGDNPTVHYTNSAMNSPTQNTQYLVSSIFTGNASDTDMSVLFDQNYADAVTANGKVMEIQYVAAIDLTSTFGAGNEPTKAQMDTIMNSYPNSWFNITAKANL